jgi:HlyD family secretion protein
MAAETEKADLSGLRIRRDDGTAPEPGRRWATIAIIAAVLVLAGAGAYLLRGGLGGPRTVELAAASLTFPSQADAVLMASGYVVAQQKAAVASKGTGRLEYLGVEEGDRVKKGQIIARLEDGDVMAGLAKAKADLAVTQADVPDARQSLDRQKTLFASGLTSQAELDAAMARWNRVAASVASAEAAVNAATVALENTRIRAPFDGTVLTKNADVGEVVAPFASSASSRAAVVTIADMSSLQVEADVSEANITRVSAGQPCTIVLDAYPSIRYQGHVHKIVPTADRAKATVLTKVAFVERDSRVLPEMSAKVTFLSQEPDAATANAPAVLTVPLSSVADRGKGKIVLLVRDGVVQETPVTTGGVIGARIAVTQGLAQGDQVVLRPDP